MGGALGPDRGLSEDEMRDKIAELREGVSELASASNLTSWVTKEILVKYLRARQWNVKKAIAMLRNSLEWRAARKPSSIRWNDVEDDCRCGKMYLLKCSDAEDRPVILMRPGNEEHYGQHDRNINFLIYTLESAVRSMPEHGDGKTNIIIDYQGWTLRNSPPLRTTKETISILQNQYPERLHKAYLYNPPGIFSVFFGMARPFLDPVTAGKINFIYSSNEKSLEILEANFNLDELEKGVGGRSDEAYDHLAYSARMLDEERRRGGKDTISGLTGEGIPPAGDATDCVCDENVLYLDRKDTDVSSSNASASGEEPTLVYRGAKENGGPNGNGFHDQQDQDMVVSKKDKPRKHSDITVIVHLFVSSFFVTVFLSCLRLFFGYAFAQPPGGR